MISDTAQQESEDDVPSIPLVRSTCQTCQYLGDKMHNRHALYPPPSPTHTYPHTHSSLPRSVTVEYRGLQWSNRGGRGRDHLPVCLHSSAPFSCAQETIVLRDHFSRPSQRYVQGQCLNRAGVFSLPFWLHCSQILLASAPNSLAAASSDFFSAVSIWLINEAYSNSDCCAALNCFLPFCFVLITPEGLPQWWLMRAWRRQEPI